MRLRFKGVLAYGFGVKALKASNQDFMVSGLTVGLRGY